MELPIANQALSEFIFTRSPKGRDANLYEIYHENSKLNIFSRGTPLTSEQIYITSRSTRGSTGNSFSIIEEASPSIFDGIIANRRSARNLNAPVNFDDLSALLRASAGVTGFLPEDNGPLFALRASPSAGALYPIDLYLVILSAEGLGRGVYYFHPFRQALELLQEVVPERIANEGFFSQALTREASSIFLMVANFHRTTWKYGERGYRLCLLDAGHMAENIVLKATEIGCASVPIAGFHDDFIARELGIDGVTEAVVHSVAVGGQNSGGISNAR